MKRTVMLASGESPAEENDAVHRPTGATGQYEPLELVRALNGVEYHITGALFNDFEGNTRTPNCLYIEAVGCTIRR